MQSSHPACYNSVVVLLSGRQRYKAVVFVVYCCIGSASKYDNFLNAQRRGRDQFRVLQCCSAAVCMLQVAVMINAVQFNNPVMLHTGNMWGVYNRTLHTGNTPAPCPQAAHGCTLQCALRAVSVCADKMAPSTVLLRISAFYSDILQIYMSPGMRKLILVHTDLDR